MSLNRHLTSSSSAHGRLAFHPDCPRCQAERLLGPLGSDRLVTLRAQAAVAAGVIAFSAGVSPGSAIAQVADQEQEGTTDPGTEEPGFETDFDPGTDYDEPTIDVPNPDGDTGGDSDDDGDGGPLGTEPLADPVEPPGSIPDPPEPPPAQPAPPAEPEPATPPPPPTAPEPPSVGTPPAPPPAAPDSPQALLQPAGPKSEGPVVELEIRDPDRRPPTRRPAPTPRTTPPASAPAPVVAPAPGPAVAPEAEPVQVVPVSQQDNSTGADARASGGSYTVQPGDSLWAIARSQLGAGASAGQIARLVSQLWKLNHARIGTGDPDMLHVGTVLRLP